MISLIVTPLISVLACLVYRWAARQMQILDHPNQRSAHQRPTPHGGGVPLLLAFATGMAVAALEFGLWPWPYLFLLGVALLLMLAGVLDDVINLSVNVRMALYVLAAFGAVVVLGTRDIEFSLGFLVLPVSMVATVWFINLYNFMDGIDGIAAVQCILMAGSVAMLVLVGGGDQRYVLVCLLLALAHLGFLVLNWPPASLFMGDAGSIPTGFLLAGLALFGWQQGIVSPAIWLILASPFIVDTTWTLAMRVLRGERVTEAHAKHAYQRLARRWNSHLLVDVALIALNAVWLFPLAWAVTLWPEQQWKLVILAIIPLLLIMARMRHIT